MSPVARPLRLLVVTASLHRGGAERQLATLLPALDPARVTSAVCCIQGGGEYFTEAVAAGLACRALGLSRRRQAPRALLRLIGELRRFRPDVVLTFPLNADILGRVAAAILGVRGIGALKHSCHHTRRHPLDRAGERLLAGITDACVAVTPAQVPFLVGRLGVPERKIRIVPNGVDATRLTPPPDDERRRLAAGLGLPSGAPVVGIVARLSPEKDHATFLAAARLVARRRPEARFLIVGDGPLRAALEASAAAQGLAAQAVFAGARANAPRLHSLMDVAVLSSVNDCFPFAALEAMAMGVPLVATAVGALGDIVEPGTTGHLVPPRDPPALAERIAALLDDPGLARAMGAAARRRVERSFAIERAARTFEGVLDELARPAPGGGRTLRPRRGGRRALDSVGTGGAP